MGCCEMTFEQEVRDEIMKYINTLNIANERKNYYINLIEDDLKKKSAALNSYHYQYRDDDKTKVVEEYKTMISNELGQPRTQPQQDKNNANKNENKVNNNNVNNQNNPNNANSNNPNSNNPNNEANK
jgi:hypothetical protein